MLITRTSPISGKEHTMMLDISSEQWVRYMKGDENVQDLFPHLTKDEREFLITGITEEEWESIMDDGDGDGVNQPNTN